MLAIRQLFLLGREAWPEIALDEQCFGTALDWHERLTANASDLYLARAAAHGVPQAVAAFERDFIMLVPQLVRRMDLPRHTIDELCQRLREQLLLPRGERPSKLVEYSGRGSLVAWLRVVALHAAVDLLRSEPPPARELVDRDLGPANDASPDRNLSRARYKQQLAAALRMATARLSSQQRKLLRHSLVDGVTLEQIASRFRVSKSTVHRWLEEVHRQLSRDVRRFFRDELGMEARDLESMVRTFLSQVELSLHSLLRAH